MGYLNRDGSGWWVGRWTDAAGKRRSRRLSRDEKYARETLTLLEGEALRYRLLEIRPLKKIRFNEYAEKFMEYCEKQIRSARRYETSLKSLIEFFQNRYLTSIDSLLVEEYRQRRLDRDKVQKSTVNRDLQVLRRMLNLAIAWGFLRENPTKFVKFFRESTGRIRYLKREEFDRLLRMAPDHLKPLLEIAVNTGMRQAEMLGLTWTEVDLENGFLSLNDTKTYTPRKVPLNEPCKKALLELRIMGHGPHVFIDAHGKKLVSRTVQWQFRKLLEEAGIENFRFHDLRHTCASWLAMAGVPIRTIMEVLGHKDIRMTLRYSHLSSDQKVDAVNKLDGFVRSSNKSKATGSDSV